MGLSPAPFGVVGEKTCHEDPNSKSSIQHTPTTLIKTFQSRVLVAHTCNPSY
jgi:hypothetical protein